MMAATRLLALVFAASAANVACVQSARGGDETGARRLGEIQDLHGPEAVMYDPDQDVYFVSNILGYGSDKDNNGYIVRVNAAQLSDMRIVVAGGRNGVMLHAPKGMALVADTVWVADIDVLRGFHRVSGLPLRQIDFTGQGAVMLNDVTVASDGTLYVTDSAIRMTDKGIVYVGGDKIFAVRPDGRVSVVATGDELGQPNGIVWDADSARLIVAAFAPFSGEIYSLDPGTRERTLILRGKGRFDGLAMHDGALLATSWSDSTLRLIDARGERRLLYGLAQPAAIGVDTRRGRVAIPLVNTGWVLFRTLP